jgi:tRNA(Ile)-lysidine synthase
MNADPAYTRVRVRTDLLPAFEAALGPGVAEALGRTAALLADDADALDLWAAQALAECHDELGGLSVEALTALPAAVRTRVVKAAAAASGAPALTSAHLRALEQLVIDWHGQGAVGLPGAWVGERACGRLTLRPPALPPPAQLPPDG